ncbi:MAG: hypothetical protein AB8F78_01900 [Saprospiraceae bacterium]
MGMFSMVLVLPVFIDSSILAIVIPSERKFGKIHKYLSSLVYWIGAMGLSCAAIFTYNTLRNLSPVIYAVEFYWDVGIDMEFRENGTFKVLNSNMGGGFVSYGDYKIVGSTIILEDEVRWDNLKLNDTLQVTERGINFTLDKPHRDLSEGTMGFSVMPSKSPN